MEQQLFEYLLKFVTEGKKQRIEEVISTRTKYLTIAIEDVYLPQNASAVVRSCDCFGVQDIHIIENVNKYQVNPHVSLGASKWVDIIKYNQRTQNNALTCINSLKSKGYKIIATTPHSHNISLNELPLDSKIALFFGNERDGLSKDVIDNADGFLKIPMTGFTESLNISVSAAICMQNIMARLWNSDIPWKLTPLEEVELRHKWVRKNVKKIHVLENEYYSSLNSKVEGEK